jgi:hypothetical protein
MIGSKAGEKAEKETRHDVRGTGGFCLVVFFLAGWAVAPAGAKYGGGNGTANAPFLINTPEDFKLIGNSPEDWDKQFKLMQNLDLAGFDETSLRMIGRWASLGSYGNQPFRGIFDGNGKTIFNFKYADIREEYVGLFQHVTGEIRDLKLVGAVVEGNKSGTGALVGYLEKGGALRCAAVNVNVAGNQCVGGLVGSLADGTAGNCWSSGSVSGVWYTGGLVGQAGKGTIAYSYSKARVTGGESTGGLAGGTVREEAIVNSCYAQGPVQGTLYVGGLVGQVVAGRVFRCYSTGEVTGNQSTGGLAGYGRALGQVIDCLWDTQSSKQATSVGGTGRTTVEMKTMDPYLAKSWDFWQTWTICEGTNYPVLLWQIPLGDLSCPDGVNFYDFAIFAENWRKKNCGAANLNCGGADLDGSGSVELRDLAIFAENWLAGL